MNGNSPMEPLAPHPDDQGAHGQRHIEVADTTLTFRRVQIDDLTPTGSQLAEAAGFKPTPGVTVLHLLKDGSLEDLRPTETVNLREDGHRFVIVESDRSYRFTIDGQRFDWPCRVVSGGQLRKLGQVPTEAAIHFEQFDTADRRIEDQELVDLNATAVESFVSRRPSWKLNVQGVLLESHAPILVVREALVRAGFDPELGWQIFLKVAGQPKRAVELTNEIDLRTPGIEKLRLTPNEVNNGEQVARTRQFGLLDTDEAHLDRLGVQWQTIVEANRRWLLIDGYPVPDGYTARSTQLALEIPPTYPGAQVYGFYAYPPLALSSGRPIDSTQMRGTLLGLEFHGWSRHRGPNAPWDPNRDSVITQLALVDAALAKEVGE